MAEGGCKRGTKGSAIDARRAIRWIVVLNQKILLEGADSPSENESLKGGIS